MKSIFKSTVLSVVLLSSLSALAGNLYVTCGRNAYESLDSGDLTRAEFLLQLETRGPNQPPVLVKMFDEGNDLARSFRVTSYTNTAAEGIKVSLENRAFDQYEIKVRDCSDIETATGTISFSKYVGGFAGRGRPITADCSCSNRRAQ